MGDYFYDSFDTELYNISTKFADLRINHLNLRICDLRTGTPIVSLSDSDFLIGPCRSQRLEVEFVNEHFHWGFWAKSREFSDLRFLP